MDKLHLIFVPAMGAGHLISTLEFAIRLLDRDDRVSVTVLVMKAPFAAYLDSYTNSVVSSQPRLTLIDLPAVELPRPGVIKSVEHFITVFIESHVPHVRRLVGEILSDRSESGKSPVKGLVLDLFCESMIDVAKEFSLPSYIYLTSNAGFLSLMLELPDHHDRIQRQFQSSDAELLLPGFVSPVPISALPGALFDGEHGGYSAYIKLARGFRECRGILVNTFAKLDPFDFSSLIDNQRASIPVVYKIGPVLNLKGLPHPAVDRLKWDDIWTWLDDQPTSSVVFLCFGSGGVFGEAQAREIAAALERTGKSFLWSLRLSLEKDADADPESILPEGFLERTRGRGVVCGWAPQVEVLAHEAIGGFVSHCGWNSTLESLWYGVPTATWPKYAEQQLNAFLLVKEWGLAADLRSDYRDGAQAVAADEIERAICCLMDSDDNEARKKVKAMKDLARKAVTEGGSSFKSIGRFIEDLLH